MTTYSYSQLETLWLNTAKGTKYATQGWASLMAAIAMAESGGRSDAINPSGASGIWQILGAVNASDQNSLMNPQVNAHEALLKLQSQGLGAWQTYTEGTYLQFLKPGTNPSSLPTTGGGGNDQSGASANTDSLIGIPGQITGFFGDAKTLIDALLWIVNPASWLRIGSFVLGIMLLVIAVYALIKVGSDGPMLPQVVPVPV